VWVIENNSGQQREYGCSALFVFIGAEPLTQFLPKSIALDHQGYVVTGNDAVKAKVWKVEREPLPLA